MSPLARLYPSSDSLLEAWIDLFSSDPEVAGRSVGARCVPLWDVGPKEAPVVFLSGLIHGVEVVGGVALYAVMDEVMKSELPESLRFVVMPIVNPDAFEENMRRVARGVSASRRTNANGVDLNRNFPLVRGARAPWHPMGGSRYAWSPHYVGPAPLSEPESRAVRDVAVRFRPSLAMGFHSFGNVLLHPWAHTYDENPRAPEYGALGRALARASSDYRVMTAASFYRTIGDMDDWLHEALGTLAFTIEVGSLGRRILHPRRALDPFCWMNPTSSAELERTIDVTVPGVMAMLRAFAAQHQRSYARSA